MKLKLIAVAMIASGLAISGCAHRDTGAAAGTSRSAAEVTSDAALTTKVKASLAANAGLGTAADVNVNSFRGVVQLNGFVASQEQAKRAAEVAGKVEGVQSVQNNLRVKPAG
jgi:hyperosmotically inducible protein